MSGIQLPGLSTGLDTSALIQQLMQVERRRLMMYENRVTQRTDMRSAVTELQSKLTSLQSSLEALSDAGRLRGYNATSSNSDKVSVQASSGAHEGSHSVQVKQLATANRWVHDGFKYASSFVGAGTFILSYNHQEMVVQTTDQTTLQDMVNLINNDPDNPGVTAGILNYDDGSGNAYHLVLNGRQSGSDYQVSINSSNTQVHTAAAMLTSRGSNAGLTTRLVELNDFSEQGVDFQNVNEVVVSGALNDGTVVNVAIATNQHTTVQDLIGEIENAFGKSVKVTLDEGQLKITDKSSGVSQMSLALSFNTPDDSAALSFDQTAVGGSINASIAAFDATTFLETQIARDSLIKVDDYPPGANNWINRSTNSIDDVISGVTLNLHGTTGNVEDGFESLEINLNRDTESLKEKMRAMIDAYNTVAMYFDEKTKYDAETNTAGILSREYGLTSLESLLRSTFLSNATGFTSADGLVNPRDIGLSFGSDGLIRLDEEAFDAAIVKDYRGVLSLIGAQKAGSSSGADAAHIKFYDSSKYTQAGAYNVRVVIDGDGNITSALIKRANEDWSQARQAEVSGNYILGAPGTPGSNNPEMDLQLAIDTSRINQTLEVTVNVRQGFAGTLHDLVEKSLHPTTGRITASRKSLDSQISGLNTRIEQEEARLERVHGRLVAQYARLERLLTTIQQQFSGLMY